MKIAVFHELHQGGARRAVIETGKRLSKLYATDLYISAEKTTSDEKESFRKVHVSPFHSKVWKQGDWLTKLYKDTVEYFKLLNHHKKIAERINKNNYDIVIVHPSKFTQAPFVLLFLKNAKWYYCHEPLRIIYDKALNDLSHIHGARKGYELIVRLFRRLIDRVNLSRANMVICNSYFCKDSIKKAYGIKSKVRYFGVDHVFFSPSKGKKDIDILYFGSHERIDQYGLFKEAISKLPQKLNVYEHFSHEKWLTDLMLRKLYRRAKIVVTLHKNEPFGLIPLEAASCGIPVIALDSGGHRETVVNSKTGFLVSEDPDDLALKILSLLRNVKKRNLMSILARENVLKNWTWETNTKLIINDVLKFHEKRN